MKRAPNVRSAREGYDRSNREAARVILSDIVKYGGEGGLMVTWARLVIEKAVPGITGPLFAVVDQHQRRAA